MALLDLIADYTDNHYDISITNVNPNLHNGHFMFIELTKDDCKASKYIHLNIFDPSVGVWDIDEYIDQVFKELAVEVDNKIKEGRWED